MAGPVGPQEPGFLDALGAAWGTGGEELRRFYSEDAEYVDVASDVRTRGRDGVARFCRWQLGFASDSVVEFTSMVGGGRNFGGEWTWSGTADGKLQVGETLHAGTGRRFAVPGVAIFMVDDTGAVTLHKDYWDFQTLLEQTGIGR